MAKTLPSGAPSSPWVDSKAKNVKCFMNPRWSWMGPNYPFFIGNHIIFNIFGLTNVVLGGQGLFLIIRFSLEINSYLTLLALKSIQGTEAVPLGPVLGRFWPP